MDLEKPGPHTVVRACFRFDIKQERKKLIEKSRFPTIDHLGARDAEYQAEIARRLQPEEKLIRMDIEQLNQQIKSIVASTTEKICTKVRKLTTSTVVQMDQRRGLEKGTEEHRTLNKRVKKPYAET
ncbi:hypothetical protein HHI36_004021 [Cryptolaemus montrouzieri]|uniref:Tektin n=1 Tax=Cryptolaemus montrouzieri TaxID=559131 RepID=A0ABD2NQC8_9CUCU